MKTYLIIFFLFFAFDVYSQSLNSSEKEGLLLMREEEKLARDVYSKLFDIWNVKIFENISRSEQNHMNRVKELLIKYTIPDPIDIDSPGIFKNSKLQATYDSFVLKGQESLYSAFTIGAMVEDLDIYDLEKLMQETRNKDLLQTYTNLRDGSINHIKSFNKQILSQGEAYTAHYISQNYLIMILGH
ncbi:DUF2202 domain-containing protein [Spirochaeta cellobiosiphila]|uniref:DUF2202 domain-containing protein n=1 Tax=Spirochaeta cellobiosiphila TaxID=504483 RepID=UPI00055B2EFA|nr:DUF2202 domain-containing protein [Spirochaeta cellobiosiphila]